MGIHNKIAQYRAWKEGVKHCTFNPEGPGVVRIHLVPPRFRLLGNPSHIVILNGYYLLPLGYSWAILLAAFITEVNRYDGAPMDEEAQQAVYANTVDRVHKIYRSVRREALAEDLDEMLDILFDIAQGGKPDVEIERLSIRSYAKYMTAPHRMDLMVSAMTDANGMWQCNRKCVFCYAAGEHYAKGHELSTEEWKQAIDKLRKAGVPMLTFTGGEPTMRQDLCELIDYAKWFVTRLNTNGALLTKSLVQELKAASLDSLQVTLYSSSAEIHNALVGCDGFESTAQGLQNAIEAGLDVSVNTPLCKKNADYLSTLEYLYRLGVRFVTVSGLICTGYAGVNHEEYDLDGEELYRIVKSAKEFCNTHGMEIDFTSPGLIAKERLEALGMNVPSCGAALSNMAVAPDGTVLPCQSWLTRESGCGNLLTDDWKSIWAHPGCALLRTMRDEDALNCPFRTSVREV